VWLALDLNGSRAELPSNPAREAGFLFLALVSQDQGD
jgi:hypothetical protein